ncbi:hypothetical protein NHX12_009662 [Muraenolepis orangiensis]|uniref:Uncharacterized protein n=1 Tax=Muraenolepis orangiensis TaxID=630683 RepID=A0A9Q0I8K8_9TELE|nr:hypothetical protein NHX12_009662 [Muraenolepis orangiensis]
MSPGEVEGEREGWNWILTLRLSSKVACTIHPPPPTTTTRWVFTGDFESYIEMDALPFTAGGALALTVDTVMKTFQLQTCGGSTQH